MTIIVNKFGASLTDDARVVIYDRHMFIVQATGLRPICRWRKRNSFLTNDLRRIPTRRRQLRLRFRLLKL